MNEIGRLDSYDQAIDMSCSLGRTNLREIGESTTGQQAGAGFLTTKIARKLVPKSTTSVD